ncbi:ABC transporter ATP-binding protein, partial [Candidatus Woesearchaeota archaeon]|nr:ABC transporter ATP-binding protein [Candidatus Woesearchaeota archaeon]
MDVEDHQEEKVFKVDYRRNLKNLWSLLRHYKPISTLMLVVILLLQIGYVAERYLFKVFIDAGTEYAQGLMTAEALLALVFIVLGLFLIVMALSSGLVFIRIHLLNHLDGNLIVDVKRKFFNHLVHLHHGFHTSHKTGSMISRIGRGGAAVERIVDVIMFNFAPMTFLFTVAILSMLS